jgi:hypothetical protein
MADSPPLPPRVLGRRIALAVYYVGVVAVSLVAAVQITAQVLFGPAPPPPYATCHEGLRALFAAVGHAREAAAGSDTEGEDEALARFRKALAPEWTYRDSTASLCRGAPRDEATLDAIERLRYAEEHAVRREAEELAPLRRRVQALVEHELGPAAINASAPEGHRPSPSSNPGHAPAPD